MKNKLLIITFLFVCNNIFAQSKYPFFDGTDNKTKALMFNANKQIEEIRKGNFTLTIVNEKGEHINKTVTLELVSHDFNFGVNLYGYEKIPDSNPAKQTSIKAIQNTFNSVIVCDYWKRNQKKSNSKLEWTSPDYGFQLAEKLNKKTRFHALIYGHPDWLHEFKTEEDMWKLIELRIKSIADRYGDKITEVDVINEFINGQYWDGPKQKYLRTTKFPNFAKPYNGARVIKIARKYLPSTKLVILEANLWNQQNPVFQEINEYHKNLIQQNVDYDYIGYQAHYYAKGNIPFQEGTKEFGPRTFMMDEINKGIEKIGQLGKPIVITEFNPPSRNNKVKIPNQVRISDKEIAAWESNFYTLMFSKPYVKGISRWFTIDNLGGRGMDAGIVNEDGKLKPNYYALEKLIKSKWHTQLKTKIKKGLMNFRGFYGTYKVQVYGYEDMFIKFVPEKNKQNVILNKN